MRANRVIWLSVVSCVVISLLGRFGTAETRPASGSGSAAVQTPKLADEFPELAPTLVKTLVEILGNNQTAEGYQYARVLNRLGPAAMTPLLGMLESEDNTVRLRALHTLFYIADGNEHIREAIPALTKILQEKKDEELCGLALVILQEILSKDASSTRSTKFKLPVQGEPILRGQLVNVTFTRPDGSKAGIGSSEGLDDDLIQMGAIISVYPDYLIIESRGMSGHITVERYRDLHEVVLMK